MKNIVRLSVSVLGLLALSATSQLHAQILLGFDFTGMDGSEATASSTFEATGINSSTLSRGSGTAGSATNFLNNTDTFNVDAGSSTTGFNGASLAAAISNNQYYQWTFSASATTSLTTLNYSVYAQNNGSTPENFSGDVQYSLDGFATAGIDLGGFSGVTPRSGDNNYLSNPESNDLSGIADLQNIIAGQTVTFRFYGFDGASYTDQGFGRAASNDLTISGTVVVPEPSTVVLMVCSGLGLLAFSRLRKLSV